MELKEGIKGEFHLLVTREMLAKSMSSGAVEVFATPWMIAIMEAAAQDSVASAVGEGNITVGTQVNIAHLASTPEGAKVRAESELVSIDGRKLTFRVSAYDEMEKIGEGTHERFIVQYDRFMEKCNRKARG